MKIRVELSIWENKALWDVRKPLWRKEYDSLYPVPAVVGYTVSFAIGPKMYTVPIREVDLNLEGTEHVQTISVQAAALLEGRDDLSQDPQWTYVGG